MTAEMEPLICFPAPLPLFGVVVGWTVTGRPAP